MIQATIYQKDKRLDGFKIVGHAQYAAHGKDIVCAAVSMLAITTVNSLLEQVGTVLYTSDEGCLICHLSEVLDDVALIKAQAILKTLEIGLNTVKLEYPKYIMVQNLNIEGGAQSCYN